MDRYDFYFKQRVTEDELDQSFAAVETALWNLVKDQGQIGIITGANAVQHDPTNLSIVLTGPATGYDKAGKRLYFVDDLTVDLSVDENGVPTTVTTEDNGRWLSVFLEFDRELSDLRVDGASQQVYYSRAEAVRAIVRQGAEAAIGAEVRPNLSSDMLLVCDVKIVHGTLAVTNAMINTDRRESIIYATAGEVSVNADAFLTLEGATAQAVLASADAHIDSLETGAATSLARMNAHVGGTAEKHAAAAITTAAGDWDRLTATDAQAAFTEVDAALQGLSKVLLYQIGPTILNGLAPTDGGGLTVNVAAGWAIVSSGDVFFVGDTIDVPDDDVSWVYVNSSGELAWAGLGPLAGATAIAKVTAAGGDITELIDLRVVTDNNRKQLKIRVGSDNSAHFTRLSDAVVALEQLRLVSTLFDFEIELVGLVAEDDAAKLPIVFSSNGWRVRGLTNSRLDCGVALTSEFIRIEADDIVIEDVEIRFQESTDPSNAEQNRYTFLGSDCDRVVLRRIVQDEFDAGVHGFLTFDPDELCRQWTVEGCRVGDCRDFAIRVPSPNTGGQGVLIDSVFRDNIFVASSAGARFAPSDGIRIDEGADILIDNCRVENFDQNGICIGDIDATRRVRVTNCYVKNCAGNGIHLRTYAQQCHVAHNDIDDVPALLFGISVAGKYNFICFNHIDGNASSGLQSGVGCEFNIFLGNQSRGAGNNVAVDNTDANNRDDA